MPFQAYFLFLQIDDKIIAIPFNDPSWNSFKSIKSLPQHLSDEIEHFFQVYKMLEHKETTVLEVLGVEEAKSIISKCIARYENEFEDD